MAEPTPQVPKPFPVSWDELHRNAKALAWRLLDLTPSGGWRGLVAVTRGGLVPAAIVARELDIRHIVTVCVIGYGDDDSNPQMADKVKIIGATPDLGDGSGWLVVDDLVDTGRTMVLLRQWAAKAHFAAVYAKPLGKPLIDTYVTEVSQDTWIYFPWDVDLQFAKPIASLGNSRKI